MKELTIEQKARNYDEAIKKLRDFYRDYNTISGLIDVKEELANIFPELKESEESKDERIRGNIIATIHLYYGEPLEDEAKEMIAWLEKQGEHAKFRDSIQVGDKVTRNKDGVLINLSQLERVAKPADKVEPKFKVGDIVKHKDNPHLTYILKRFTADGDYEFHAIGKDGNEGCIHFAGVKYQDEWELVEQKPAWSEEDEDNLNSAIYYIRREPYRECDVEPIVDWLRNKLKSLRLQNKWKPSDKQIEALEHSLGDYNIKIFEDRYEILKSLYQDLKKLREE